MPVWLEVVLEMVGGITAMVGIPMLMLWHIDRVARRSVSRVREEAHAQSAHLLRDLPGGGLTCERCGLVAYPSGSERMVVYERRFGMAHPLRDAAPKVIHDVRCVAWGAP